MTEIEAKVGIVGTGFIARGLILALHSDKFLSVSRVLTRRNITDINDLAVDSKKITNSIKELIDNSDIIVECTGDPIHATEVISQAMDAGLKVVTMDAELHLTSGSWLASKGYITEAEGDQPGSIAALYTDVIEMGFNPLVYGNIKGFLNLNPTKEDMLYWSKKQGIRLNQVTSFTDGTKIQIEQALVANGLGADIAKQGLTGIECEDYRIGAYELSEISVTLDKPISDYVLSPKWSAGVFITATHIPEQAPYLQYYKLGDGPYYIISRPFHLCHLEVPKTIRRVLHGESVLLNNTLHPKISVATISKRKLQVGEKIKRGLGGFDVRGEAISIAENINHVPIGLMFDVTLKKKVDKGQVLTFDDIEIPDSLAYFAWKETLKSSVNIK